MKVLHQHGHNFVWNLNSFSEDGAGDGHIVSPVNIESDKISKRISEDDRKCSFLDPQFYLPDNATKKLQTYPFFPGNILDPFSTSDFLENAHEIAGQCLEFQRDLGFQYSVIPTRYFHDLPENALDQLTAIFIEPFISEHKAIDDDSPLLLTVIAKPTHLEEGLARTELISWITNYPEIQGVYLIFENDFYSKQIKNPEYLSNQLLFIHDLRLSGLEVHVGYTNTEAYLLSIADPTSVAMGAYENLRSFGTLRLESRDTGPMNAPSPRVYSGKLLQWIEDTYLPAFRRLVPNWEDLFDDSSYKSYLLNPQTKLNFQRKEIYKHYFSVFSQQIRDLPMNGQDRTNHVRKRIEEAIELFEVVKSNRVFLDSDSDGSHLPAWINAISIYLSAI